MTISTDKKIMSRKWGTRHGVHAYIDSGPPGREVWRGRDRAGRTHDARIGFEGEDGLGALPAVHQEGGSPAV